MTYFLQVPRPPDALQLTDALAEAVAEAAKLCVEDQNYIAFRIMEEVTEERKWAETNTLHSGKLPKLAIEALGERARGETIPLEDFLRDSDA